MDDLSRFCCLNSRCPDLGRRDAGNLTVTGRLGKARQFRLLYCRTCRARFSERKGTPLYRAHLPEDKALSILDHIKEGCGVLKTARLVKVHPDTVSRYVDVVGAASGVVTIPNYQIDNLLALIDSVAGSPTRRASGDATTTGALRADPLAR